LAELSDQKEKINLLRYLTLQSVHVNMNNRNEVLSNSFEYSHESKTLKELNLGFIKLINNIKVHVALDRHSPHIQTCTSFSRSFNKNIVQEDLLLKTRPFLAEKKRQWLHVQKELKKLMSLENDAKIKSKEDLSKLKYIAGVDIIFNKENLSIACVGIVIYELYDFWPNRNMQCIYKHCHYARVNAPLISSFQVFREYICYNELFSLVPKNIFPQLIIFNSHGQFHEIKFGLACHVGVLHDVISIGVDKTCSYLIDSKPHFRYESDILKFVYDKKMRKHDSFPIKTSKNEPFASIYLNSDKVKPLFISAGNKITMERSLEFLRLLSKLQTTLDDRDEFRQENKLPVLINHAHVMTKKGIANMEKNEFLLKNEI
jgi:deoxyinosine 3'endonuclease (endonuclease V)